MKDFSVKAVAERTGINAHTLRVWERRYQVVKPARKPNGRRAYTKDDIEKLRLLNYLVGKGHPISGMKEMTLDDLRHAVAETRGEMLGRQPDTYDPAAAGVNGAILDHIIEALENFHLREINEHLVLARLQMSVRDFVFSIVSPLLARVGELVDRDQFSIAHEHALSAILKTQIYQALATISPGTGSTRDGEAARIVVATLEGDFHEFGILLAALLVLSRRLSLYFFGANMPAKPLADAANALRANAVLVAKTFPGSGHAGYLPVEQKRYLKELDNGLMANTEIWLGGHVDKGATAFRARHPFNVLPTLHALDQHLATLT